MSKRAKQNDTRVIRTKTISSPVGDLVLYATDDALVAAQMVNQKHAIDLEAEAVRGPHPILDSAVRDFAAYFSGNAVPLKTPLAAKGTAFQQLVWAALRTIPFGETWSYAQLAKKIGKPNAVRAVGTANSRNPIAILVPCHRVIAMSGALTGYAGGIDKKEWLLAHEARQQKLLG
ncbi:MAG: methylated-DNA--[protein]-cysteine S-methyltransferase [Polyangiaceae bacterium]